MWFSLRTHASQIWQNPQQLLRPEVPGPGGDRASAYQKLIPTALRHSESVGQKIGRGSVSIPGQPNATTIPQPEPTTPAPSDRRISYARPPSITLPPPPLTPGIAPLLETVDHAIQHTGLQPTALPENMTREDFTRAVAVATVSALRHQEAQAPGRYRASGAVEVDDGAAGQGGHEAPSWSRSVSASVLLVSTALYAVIAGAPTFTRTGRYFTNHFVQNYSLVWSTLYSKGLGLMKNSLESPCSLWYRTPRSS